MIDTLMCHRRRVAAPGRARPFAANTAPGRRARAFLTTRPGAVTLALPAPILARRALAARPPAARPVPAAVEPRTRSVPWSALATVALLAVLVAACARSAGWL